MRPRLALAVVLLCSAAAFLTALETESSFRIGNLTFPDGRKSGDTDFAGTDYPWGIACGLSHDATDRLRLESVFSNGTVLRNILAMRVVYDSPYLSASIGPFFGLFNSGSIPVRPGVTASATFTWPGVLSLTFRGDTSLGGALSDRGDYRQDLGEIVLGFPVPNADCSISLSTQRYREKTSGGTVTDTLSYYAFASRIRSDGVPYSATISLGYQALAKRFESESGERALHGLGTVALGTRIDLDLPRGNGLFVDLLSGVYTFGYGELLGESNPGPGGYLFRLETGIRIRLDA